jgi:hypothetical protein
MLFFRFLENALQRQVTLQAQNDPESTEKTG